MAQVNVSPGYEFVDAVKSRDGGKAEQMLSEKAPGLINARGSDGDTALFVSIGRRDEGFTGFLLGKGADPNQTGKSGDTPLIVAARIGFEQATEWLLGVGAKVDATNKMGETALITAVVQRQRPVVRMLLAAGANPDKTDTAAGYSARDYAKRDPRAREILQMIEAKKPSAAN